MGISSSVGLVSGLQTDAIIKAMVDAEKAPISKLQQKEASYQAKISSYGTLKSALTTLQSAAAALKDTDNFAAGYTAASSDTDILKVSVSSASDASAGTYKIKVNNIATSAQMTGNTAATSTTTIGSGVIHFKVGTDNKVAVTIGSTQTSLSEIANAINDADAGVSASVIKKADGDYRLSIMAKDTGKDISYTYQETGMTFDTTRQATSSVGERMESQTFDSATTALGITGTLSVNGTNIALNGTETLNNLQTSIDAIANVSASVSYNSTTGKYSLVVTNDTANSTLTLNYGDSTAATGLSNMIDTGATVAAQKASVTINNMSVERESNTITDLISGVTMTLVSEDATKTFDVTVTANHDTAKSKLSSFVEAYNKVVTSLDTLQKYDPKTKVAGNLLGDSTANVIRSGMRRMIFSSLSSISTDIDNLNKLGISVGSSGQLTFNSSTFTTAMEDNPDAVTDFFTKESGSLKGFAVQFDSFLDSYTDGTDGILKAKIDGFTASSEKIEKSITSITNRASTYETNLRKQFQNLEKMLSSFQSTQSYLTNQLSSLSNMTSKF